MEGSSVAGSNDEIINLTKNIVNLQVNDQQVNLSPKGSDSEVVGSRWLRVRDSLEGIAPAVQEESPAECTAPDTLDSAVHIYPERPVNSDSRLSVNKKHINLAKIFMWDPWNKIGRKTKKEKGRKKGGANVTVGCVMPEARMRSEGPTRAILRKPSKCAHVYPTSDIKCVRFERDVQVVYFAGDQVLHSGREPLRREQEQHERNKELRGRELLGPPVRHVLRKAHSLDHHPLWN